MMSRYNIATRSMLLLFVVAFMSSCSPRLYVPMTYESDDMYGVHSAEDIHRREEERIAYAAQQREQRMAQWADALGYNTSAQMEYIGGNTVYDSPYGERLLSLSSNSYSRPSSYYSLSYKEQMLESLAEYDPSQYNVVISGTGGVSVEPKYISSMYGSWGAAPYATTWGYYPRYGWYDWRYGFTYGYRPVCDPWWIYSPYYSPYYSYGWHTPPYYYRPYVGSVRPSRTVVRRADPYVAPSSRGGGYVSGSSGRRRSDGSTVGRSSGGSYNRGGSTPTQRVTAPSSPTITRSPSLSVPSAGSSSVRTNSIGR